MRNKNTQMSREKTVDQNFAHEYLQSRKLEIVIPFIGIALRFVLRATDAPSL